ncbi:hypothetical protein K438DRAFT_1954512 [Mycena galopus ATCC 62051]|nr:hypothetical protein K438DRAFT_1954512 [Mycena galopus ATCC 62051]
MSVPVSDEGDRASNAVLKAIITSILEHHREPSPPALVGLLSLAMQQGRLDQLAELSDSANHLDMVLVALRRALRRHHGRSGELDTQSLPDDKIRFFGATTFGPAAAIMEGCNLADQSAEPFLPSPHMMYRIVGPTFYLHHRLRFLLPCARSQWCAGGSAHPMFVDRWGSDTTEARSEIGDARSKTGGETGHVDERSRVTGERAG